jgi:hypothetical protein
MPRQGKTNPDSPQFGPHRLKHNIARAIRKNAREQGLTIEAYVVTILPSLMHDVDALVWTIGAIGVIAAEDDRAGGGPLRDAGGAQ